MTMKKWIFSLLLVLLPVVAFADSNWDSMIWDQDCWDMPCAPTWSAPVTTGTQVSVDLGSQINLTFSSVTSGGSATATIVSPESLPQPPSNFTIVGGTSYDITTVASFTRQVTVCIGYDPAQITVPASDLRLLHYSGGAWNDITQLPVDEAHNLVCGLTSSFSFFTVVELTYLPVSIEIEPGSNSTSINPKKNGKIPVAILSTNDFNAPSKLDPNSLTFGRIGDEKSLAFCSGATDVNGDALPDLVCHFKTQDAGFKCGDTSGILMGKTKDGTPIKGSGSVSIAPCK
jgi:hypothetical protein